MCRWFVFHSNCPMKNFLRINANKFSVNNSSVVGRLHRRVASCYIMLRYHTWFLQVKQCRARLVHGWVTMTDRGLSRMHGFSAKVLRRVTLTDEWPNDFCKVGIVTLIVLSRVPEGWIFYVSRLAIMSVGMMRHRMTGRHWRTGTASN